MTSLADLLRRVARDADRLSTLVPVLEEALRGHDQRSQASTAIDLVRVAAQAVYRADEIAVDLFHQLAPVVEGAGHPFCIDCGEPRPHKAHGMCVNCYMRSRRRAANRRPEARNAPAPPAG